MPQRNPKPKKAPRAQPCACEERALARATEAGEAFDPVRVEHDALCPRRFTGSREGTALAKALAAHAHALERVAEEVKAARTEVAGLKAEHGPVRARLDALLLRVAAFERGGAVLFMQRGLEDLLVPDPDAHFRDCDRNAALWAAAKAAGPAGLRARRSDYTEALEAAKAGRFPAYVLGTDGEDMLVFRASSIREAPPVSQGGQVK